MQLQLTTLVPGHSYYFKVQASQANAFSVGSYRLKIDTGTLSQAVIQLPTKDIFVRLLVK